MGLPHGYHAMPDGSISAAANAEAPSPSSVESVFNFFEPPTALDIQVTTDDRDFGPLKFSAKNFNEKTSVKVGPAISAKILSGKQLAHQSLGAEIAPERRNSAS